MTGEAFSPSMRLPPGWVREVHPKGVARTTSHTIYRAPDQLLVDGTQQAYSVRGAWHKHVAVRGKDLIGERIRLYWAGDKKYYAGRVKTYKDGMHGVKCGARRTRSLKLRRTRSL
jgi:hypothetical protein